MFSLVRFPLPVALRAMGRRLAIVSFLVFQFQSDKSPVTSRGCEMRRLFVTSVVVFVLSIVVGNAWGVVQYTMTDLGMLSDSTYSVATGINDKGQVVGCSYFAAGSQAFLYSDGGPMQNLGMLPGGGANTGAFGINKNGQIVGVSGSHAFLYSDGGPMQDLGTLPGAPEFTQYAANGINDGGQVVGSYLSPNSSNQAFLYSSSGGMKAIGGGYITLAAAINNSGQVAGHSSNGHAVLYNSASDSTVDLGTLGGINSYAQGINNNGQVVGYADSHGWSDAFLWQSGIGMRNLGTLFPSDRYSKATAINDKGQVVGESDGWAFLWSASTGMQNLSSLIDPSLEWTLTNATAINNNGQIVCNGHDLSGHPHTFLLTPIPEPSTLVLLGIGAISVAGYAWRRRYF